MNIMVISCNLLVARRPIEEKEVWLQGYLKIITKLSDCYAGVFFLGGRAGGV